MLTSAIQWLLKNVCLLTDKKVKSMRADFIRALPFLCLLLLCYFLPYFVKIIQALRKYWVRSNHYFLYTIRFFFFKKYSHNEDLYYPFLFALHFRSRGFHFVCFYVWNWHGWDTFALDLYRAVDVKLFSRSMLVLPSYLY